MIQPTLELALAVEKIALQAGQLIMAHYVGELEVMTKHDASPVTRADQEANDWIVTQLQTLTPQIPIIAEESVATGIIPDVERCFWLVDPLDGTKEFIHKNDDFTVNIALVIDACPQLGVIYAPALDESYLGISDQGAWYRKGDGSLEEIKARMIPHERPIVLTSRSHHSADSDVFLSALNDPQELRRGSSLKLCILACGKADYYPRYGRTMLWDIAAGHAILSGAGGRIRQATDDLTLKYEPQQSLVLPYFIAMGILH